MPFSSLGIVDTFISLSKAKIIHLTLVQMTYSLAKEWYGCKMLKLYA